MSLGYSCDTREGRSELSSVLMNLLFRVSGTPIMGTLRPGRLKLLMQAMAVAASSALSVWGALLPPYSLLFSISVMRLR